MHWEYQRWSKTNNYKWCIVLRQIEINSPGVYYAQWLKIGNRLFSNVPDSEVLTVR